MASHDLTLHPGDPGMGKRNQGSRTGLGGRRRTRDRGEATVPFVREARHDNLTHLDQAPETLDERAMDAADGAGSALLEHDKVIRRRTLMKRRKAAR